MTQSAILTKLENLLANGIHSEAEAIYLLVEVRKLLEQQDAKKKYSYLTFHCDWALHAKLTGATAQQILEQFDVANVHLKAGMELEELPDVLRLEIVHISKMEYFDWELEHFLKANGIPTLKTTRADGWAHFAHLYAQIISDCPLVMTSGNASATIASVTLQIDMAKAPDPYTGNEMLYQVRWVIQDKNGGTGQIGVISSFRINPAKRGKTVPTSASPDLQRGENQTEDA